MSCMLERNAEAKTFQQMMACSAEILYILLNISGRECQDPILIKVNCTFLEPLTSVMYIFHYIFKHTKTHFIGIYNYYKFDKWSFMKPTAFIVYINVTVSSFHVLPSLCFMFYFLLYSSYLFSQEYFCWIGTWSHSVLCIFFCW